MSPLFRPRASFAARVALLLTALAAVMTYPQVLHLDSGVNDPGDPLLNAWALSWVVHSVRTAPAHLFDANIFHPEHGALAFSETLIGPALVTAPLRWLGAGTILVYNVVFLSGFVLSGVATALLVFALTGDRGASTVAGIIFAFLPFRMEHYGHLQLQQTEFIPLALWSIHRIVDAGRIRDGVLLGLFVAAQLLWCMYDGIFLVPYLLVVAVVILFRFRGQLVVLRTRMAALAVGAVLCLVIIFPVGRAYLSARTVVGERPTYTVEQLGATWRSYLAAPEGNMLYGWTANRFGGSERRLFVGLVPMLLAIVAIWPPVSRVRVAYALAAVVAFEMSLGFDGLGYRWLYEHVLPIRAIRVPARMGLFVGFSIAVLSGFGVARLRAIGGRRAGLVIVGVCACLVLIEYRSKPLDLAVIPGRAPAVYAELNRLTAADEPIVELPLTRRDGSYGFFEPTYMYYSTFHWRPLVVGYSGGAPDWYKRFVSVLRSFPNDDGVALLREHEARWFLVHGELMETAAYRTMIAAIDQRPDMKLTAMSPWQGSEIRLYRLTD